MIYIFLYKCDLTKRVPPLAPTPQPPNPGGIQKVEL